MAFDGVWKVEKSENYEKFMEVMGKICISLLKKNRLLMQFKMLATNPWHSSLLIPGLSFQFFFIFFNSPSLKDLLVNLHTFRFVHFFL